MSAEPAPCRLRNYTKERLQEIVTLWKEGATAPEIGARFGITRNAVIGLIHRHTDLARRRKLKAAKANRAKPPRPYIIASRPNAAPVKRSTAPTQPEPYLLLPDEPPTVDCVDNLEHFHCRWPIGDPRDSDFGYCGKTRFGQSSYCAKHKYRAAQHPEEKPALVAAE